MTSLTRSEWRGNFLLRFAALRAPGGKDISLINPYLDAYHTKSGMCFCQAVVNVGTQSMQRNLPLYLFLTASDFRAAQPPPNYNSYALRICTHRPLHLLLHDTAERHALIQLLCTTTPHHVC